MFGEQIIIRLAGKWVSVWQRDIPLGIFYLFSEHIKPSGKIQKDFYYSIWGMAEHFVESNYVKSVKRSKSNLANFHKNIKISVMKISTSCQDIDLNQK